MIFELEQLKNLEASLAKRFWCADRLKIRISESS